MTLLTRSRDDPDGWLHTWKRAGEADDRDDTADGDEKAENGESSDVLAPSGVGAGGDDAGAEPSEGGPSPRRRWRAVLVVAFVVVAALTVSPVSPFEEAREHDRVPIPPGGIEPSPTVTAPPPPKPGPAPPTLPTLPGQPPPTAPTPSLPPGPAVAVPEAISGEGYVLEYSDDFEGGAPDPDVWATAPFGGSLPPTVGGGMMTIESTQANDYRWGYVASTGPRSEGEPSYHNPRAWEQGYFEARVRYTDNPWSWPAFWLFSMSKTEAWPDEDCSDLTSEWDIMENGVGNGGIDRPASHVYVTVLHRNTTDNTPDGYCNTPDTQRHASQEFPHVNLSEWHTWAAYWSSDRFCTYMDDVQLQCMEPYDSTSQPMHLTFTIQYHPECDGCGPRPSELEMQVDWVKVWQK